MLFIGDEDRGYFVEEYCEIKGMTFGYIESNPHIKEQVNLIIDFQPADFFVIDIEQYIDDAADIVEELNRICKVVKAKPIIFAPGYRTYSSIIDELVGAGYIYFIISSNLSEMKDQLIKCMNGYYDANGVDFIRDYSAAMEKATNEEEKITSNCSTIAVTGACARIGTTTVAIQLIKNLMLQGYKACYVQMNNSNYINVIDDWYEVENDKNLSCIIYQNVEHYSKPEMIKEIMNKGYEYIVYDYGCCNSTDFNRISFLEKDFQIMVLGSDATEFGSTQKVLESSFFSDAKLIFNFTSASDEQVLREIVDDRAKDTYFMGYVPDKYSYVNENIFCKILGIDKKQTVKKKGRFFRRK